MWERVGGDEWEDGKRWKRKEDRVHTRSTRVRASGLSRGLGRLISKFEPHLRPALSPTLAPCIGYKIWFTRGMNTQSFLTERENIWWRQIFILFNFGFSLESHLLEISRTLVASKHERKGPVPMNLVGPTSLNSTASEAGVDYWLGVLWKGHIKRKERSAQLYACVFQSGELCRFVQSFKIQRLLWKRDKIGLENYRFFVFSLLRRRHLGKLYRDLLALPNNATGVVETWNAMVGLVTSEMKLYQMGVIV